jgi:UDP-N-acetylmuramate dehydrogenase
LKLLQNISLKPYNTFGIDVKAKYFAAFAEVDELKELLNLKLQTSNFKPFILGGGSNVLFIKDFDGYILNNELKGIQLIKEDKHHYYVKVAAGENWHQFVMHCISHNYAGLENLSLIPGNTGASPMQNIGAYGAEVKDVFENLDAMNRQDQSIHIFTANDCEFGYRESIFKRKYKDEFVILNVTFRLNKEPVYNTSYGAVEQELEKMGVKELSIQAISSAVINLRSSKLPDPNEIGNAGSFFKNPTITIQQLKKLERINANVPRYKVGEQHVKIPAAWLIEQCGWKGYRDGDAGVHAKQALVLVNYGNATGEEIYTLSKKIYASVKSKFGVELEREVNVI